MTKQASPNTASAVAGRGFARFITTLTAILAIAVVLLGLLTFVLLHGYLAATRSAEEDQRVRVIREVVEQRMAFYQNLVEGYARDQVLRDLIIFGDPNESLSWSLRVRDTLPQAIGAALFTADGRLVGEANRQRVGSQCEVDLRNSVRTRRYNDLPVHAAIPDLAHFDVVAPVSDEAGEALGLVFVSFTIKELQAVLERVSTGGEAAALVDGRTGALITKSRNWAQLAGRETIAQDIAGSAWRLHVRLAPGSLVPALPVVGGVVAFAVVLVVALMLVARRFLTRRYSQELAQMHGLLEHILAGNELDDAELRRADDFFPGSGALHQALAELGDRHVDLHRDSHRDELTGLANRRAFDRRLDELLVESRRGGPPFALVLLDLDGLKGVNDRHGHVAGDRALQAFAKALGASIRNSDLASRWGGDEFAALLPAMESEQMAPWLQRLRDAFDAQQTALASVADARCQVSAGYLWVASDEQRDAAALVAAADDRLYRDKSARRPRGASR